MSNVVGKVFLLGSLLILVGAFQATGYEAASVADGGSIVGQVTFSGTPPAPEKLPVTKDPEVCGKEKISEKLIVSPDNKGIQNVAVTITDIKKGKKLEVAKVEFDQKECQFRPHVLVVPASATVDIKNSDATLHNIHTFSTANPPINKAQPKVKKVMSEKFEKPEMIKVQCDAHAWMSGWFVVTDHPYVALTDAKGAFKIADVPPGTYTVEFWHETLGKQTQKVEVKPKAETSVTLEMSQK